MFGSYFITQSKIMRKLLFFLVLIVVTAATAYSPLPSDPPLKALVADTLPQAPTPLESYQHEVLTNALLEKLYANKHWKKLIDSKKMSISLVDMQDPERPRFASINGDEMMYAASLPKIAVLLAAMDALHKGELEATPQVQQDMRIMISKSSNTAASRMIDRVGYEKIAEVLTHPEYRLYDEEQGGGLWVGKRYGRSDRRMPDPMKGLSHAATSNQVARFYYLMAKGRLISPEKSQEMMHIMEGPELHHKFVNTLDRLAPNAAIYRKSGSWSTYHSDSALVIDGDWRRYILVALIDDSQGETICRQLVSEAEKAIQNTVSEKVARR